MYQRSRRDFNQYGGGREGKVTTDSVARRLNGLGILHNISIQLTTGYPCPSEVLARIAYLEQLAVCHARKVNKCMHPLS